ncbi:hypothetical protein T12_3120 [Trichinella patagoniensis]|uniref:Uncharacterized protein n=1 Tax=Trichinella patagoniensis TaxID=990121 RepID=A0A0V1AFG8_9BILA|nr:hypothetical protein T12_3120 [Trichinella patagoniensis]
MESNVSLVPPALPSLLISPPQSLARINAAALVKLTQCWNTNFHFAKSKIRLKFGQFGKRTRWKSGFGMECCFGELTRASVGLLWIDGSKRKGWVLFDFHQSLPASFAVGIRRSKLTSETFDQSAERLRRDQLCEQCAKLAPKLPG